MHGGNEFLLVITSFSWGLTHPDGQVMVLGEGLLLTNRSQRELKDAVL